MAVSAFKSTSRRGNLLSSSSSSPSSSTSFNAASHPGSKTNGSSPHRSPPRRSRSVSALARHQPPEIPSDFLNKRDNPLFSSSGSPRGCEIQSETTVRVAKCPQNAMGFGGGGGGSGDADSRRGRSVSRNADSANELSGGRTGIGRRSLSRADTGRRGRSVSQRPVSRVRHETSESEVEQECGLSANYRTKSASTGVTSNAKKFSMTGSNTDLSDRLESPSVWPEGCAMYQPSGGSASWIQTGNLEDGSRSHSLPDAEEKTIKPVFEQMKPPEDDQLGESASNGIYETVRSEVRRAISDIQTDLESAIRRHNAATIVATNFADIPPDLVNPGAVELVLDIRGEYARKLEESQERARKLRADLAVEEHRGKELSRIMKEILPDPKSTNVQKSRPVRKTSIERRKMSKRLTEEAMAYFDECVSISTFDSSDFSAPEDPPRITIGATTPEGKREALPQGSPSISTTPKSCPNRKQESSSQDQLFHSNNRSNLTASSSTDDACSNGQRSLQGLITERSQKSQFSFARKVVENVSLQHDIRNYIKNFEKGTQKDSVETEIARSNYYDTDEYTLQAQAQNVLFDRVFSKNGVESGSLLLCAGGTPVSFSPFASVL